MTKKYFDLIISIRNNLVTKTIDDILTNSFKPYITVITSYVTGLPNNLLKDKVIIFNCSAEARGWLHSEDNFYYINVKISGKTHNLVIDKIGILNVDARSNNSDAPEFVFNFSQLLGISNINEKAFDEYMRNHYGKLTSDKTTEETESDKNKKITGASKGSHLKLVK